MGGGASAPRQPLESLSADNLRELVEGLGPKYADIAKQLQENGYDGEVLADASDDDLDELFAELSVSKLQQKVLRKKLEVKEHLAVEMERENGELVHQMRAMHESLDTPESMLREMLRMSEMELKLKETLAKEKESRLLKQVQQIEPPPACLIHQCSIRAFRARPVSISRPRRVMSHHPHRHTTVHPTDGPSGAGSGLS